MKSNHVRGDVLPLSKWTNLTHLHSAATSTQHLQPLTIFRHAVNEHHVSIGVDRFA